jgi:hypothetical protein
MNQNVTLIPSIFHEQSYYHLWNSPDLFKYGNKFVFEYISKIIGDKHLTIYIIEFLLGDEQYCIKLSIQKPFYIEMKNQKKKLIYYGSIHFIEECFSEIETKWIVNYHYKSTLNMLKNMNRIIYEDDYLCVLFKK